MPNYIVTANSKFQPYTYDQLIAPLKEYGQAYAAQEAMASELESKANAVEAKLSPDLDKEAYAAIQGYTSKLRDFANTLSRQGLSMQTRKDIINHKNNFESEVGPVQNAINWKTEQVKKWQDYALQNPSAFANFNPATTSVDYYMQHPNSTFDALVGDKLTDKAAKFYENFRRELRNPNSRWKSILGGNYFERLSNEGYTASEVAEVRDQIFNDFTSSTGTPNPNNVKPELRPLYKGIMDMYQETGVDNWRTLTGESDSVSKAKALNYITNGIVWAINGGKYNQLSNPLTRASGSGSNKEDTNVIQKTVTYPSLTGDKSDADVNKTTAKFDKDWQFTTDDFETIKEAFIDPSKMQNMQRVSAGKANMLLNGNDNILYSTMFYQNTSEGMRTAQPDAETMNRIRQNYYQNTFKDAIAQAGQRKVTEDTVANILKQQDKFSILSMPQMCDLMSIALNILPNNLQMTSDEIFEDVMNNDSQNLASILINANNENLYNLGEYIVGRADDFKEQQQLSDDLSDLMATDQSSQDYFMKQQSLINDARQKQFDKFYESKAMEPLRGVKQRGTIAKQMLKKNEFNKNKQFYNIEIFEDDGENNLKPLLANDLDVMTKRNGKETITVYVGNKPESLKIAKLESIVNDAKKKKDADGKPINITYALNTDYGFAAQIKWAAEDLITVPLDGFSQIKSLNNLVRNIQNVADAIGYVTNTKGQTIAIPIIDSDSIADEDGSFTLPVDKMKYLEPNLRVLRIDYGNHLETIMQASVGGKWRPIQLIEDVNYREQNDRVLHAFISSLIPEAQKAIANPKPTGTFKNTDRIEVHQ